MRHSGEGKASEEGEGGRLNVPELSHSFRDPPGHLPRCPSRLDRFPVFTPRASARFNANAKANTLKRHAIDQIEMGCDGMSLGFN